jgi:SepF-like predicted cell division protein (DUF552 family)
MDYNQIMQILRNLSVSGNTVAATFLYALYNCEPDEREQILSQIRTFANSLNWEARQVGPSEYKTATITPMMNWD